MSKSVLDEFRETRSRMVWFPGYTPLWQKVIVEDLKRDRNAYARDYYAKHREELLRKQRERWHARKKKKEAIEKKTEAIKRETEAAKDKLAEIQDELSNDYIRKLEDDNYKLREEIEELKIIVKFLFRYFK